MGSPSRVAVAATLALCTACTALPPADIRSQRIEAAVLPMAQAALAAGQLETARRLYDRLLEVDPRSFPAHVGLGDVAMAERAPARAADAYRSAVRLAQGRPQRHDALLAHARAELAAGRTDAARESFQRLADPAEGASGEMAAWGLNGLGALEALEGDPAAAGALMAAAAERNPDEWRHQANLAYVRRLSEPPPTETDADDGRGPDGTTTP